MLTATTQANLVSMLAAGRAGGTWTGSGLASSAAAADANRVTGIAYALASDLGVSTWGGVGGAPSTALLTKVTYYGDLNLDGRVSADDFLLLDRGFAKGLAGWINGDVDYSGAVTAADYLLVDRSFALQSGPLAPELGLSPASLESIAPAYLGNAAQRSRFDWFRSRR